MSAEDFGYINVQFIGGHADGVEMLVECLYPEMSFNVFEQKYEYGEWLNPKKKQHVYSLLPDTTIYVFKRTE